LVCCNKIQKPRIQAGPASRIFGAFSVPSIKNPAAAIPAAAARFYIPAVSKKLFCQE